MRAEHLIEQRTRPAPCLRKPSRRARIEDASGWLNRIRDRLDRRGGCSNSAFRQLTWNEPWLGLLNNSLAAATKRSSSGRRETAGGTTPRRLPRRRQPLNAAAEQIAVNERMPKTGRSAGTAIAVV